MVDVRSSETLQWLARIDRADDFRDANIARAVGTRLRAQPEMQAMLVPSIAFLDDLTRWNLVLFLEKLPRETATWITRVDRLGPLSWTPESTSH